jgi:hypothetical protein
MLGTLEPVSLGFGVVLVSTEEKPRKEKLRMATHPSKSTRQMRTQVDTTGMVFTGETVGLRRIKPNATRKTLSGHPKT